MLKHTRIIFMKALVAAVFFCLFGTLAACDDSESNTASGVEDVSGEGDVFGEEDALTGDTSGAGDSNSDVVGFDPDNTSQIQLPADYFNYANPNLPAHFGVESEGGGPGPGPGGGPSRLSMLEVDNTPTNNPTTDAGATLGRVLFYDVNLSANRTVACASCHQAEFGFSDNLVLSKGFEDGDTGRHSMGLSNARFYEGGMFFWDQRAATLEDQVLMPFQDSVEMGMTLETLQARVEGGGYYPELFEAAFGDSEITTDRISLALAQFVRSMVSATSKYDVGRAQVDARSTDFPNFTDEENLGKRIFGTPPPDGGAACFVCHQGEGFVAPRATTNGLDPNSDDDLGYGGVTENPRDDGTFKVPSLRNIGIRAPFMHDGRFSNLEEVIDHYSDNIQPHPNLGPPFLVNPDGSVEQLNLSAEEKAALIAFLHTLTDTEMINDPKFSSPFME